MRNLKLLALLFCGALVIVPGTVVAGPFGIEQGMKKGQLNIQKKIEPFLYLITPPKTHPEFKTYVVNHHPKTGVCLLRAVGVTINTSVYGTELRNKFEEIREQISKIYGINKLTDMLREGSIWSEPKDWMMALKKKQRGLQAKWSINTGANLKDGIMQILLGPRATTTESGYLLLQYKFSNHIECAELMKAEAAKTF